MGAIARSRDDGLHESTGKVCPEGETHEPEWGPWMPESGMEMRRCHHSDCDLDEYR